MPEISLVKKILLRKFFRSPPLELINRIKFTQILWSIDNLFVRDWVTSLYLFASSNLSRLRYVNLLVVGIIKSDRPILVVGVYHMCLKKRPKMRIV